MRCDSNDVNVYCSTARMRRFLFFFFNDTATTEIYTLSLHDALPIYVGARCKAEIGQQRRDVHGVDEAQPPRSEEHTSELQSRLHLVCRLLLEKKKTGPDSDDQHEDHKPLTQNLTHDDNDPSMIHSLP